MTAQADPYVRVYYRIINDPKFADVFDDKAALGWWLTLLIDADAMYPASAHLPRKLKDSILKKLIDAGLVDLEHSDRYRIHGLAAEREQRSEYGRRGARALHEQRDRTATALHSEPLHSTPIRSAPLRRGATGLTPIGEVLKGA